MFCFIHLKVAPTEYLCSLFQRKQNKINFNERNCEEISVSYQLDDLTFLLLPKLALDFTRGRGVFLIRPFGLLVDADRMGWLYCVINLWSVIRIWHLHNTIFNGRE